VALLREPPLKASHQLHLVPLRHLCLGALGSEHRLRLVFLPQLHHSMPSPQAQCLHRRHRLNFVLPRNVSLSRNAVQSQMWKEKARPSSRNQMPLEPPSKRVNPQWTLSSLRYLLALKASMFR
jgi:hypothetical protein